jgi:hypothetical protein
MRWLGHVSHIGKTRRCIENYGRETSTEETVLGDLALDGRIILKCILEKYQIKEDTMGGTWYTQGRLEMQSENLKGRGNFRDQSVYGKIILKWNLKGICTGFCWLRIGPGGEIM